MHCGIKVGQTVQERGDLASVWGEVVFLDPTDENRIIIRTDDGAELACAADRCRIIPDATH